MRLSPFTRAIALIAATLMLIAAGSMIYQIVFQQAERGRAAIGGPFTLVDHTGTVVRESDFRGRLMLVFFGYTSCPDVCPAELQTIAQALDLLDPATREGLAPIFITVDPARDTVAVMARYVANFHPLLIGLTGTAEQIAAAAGAYKVYHAKGKETAPGEHLIGHSSFLYLMGRDGLYLQHFRTNTAPEEIAEAIRARAA